jgi:DNA polymerase-1
MSEAPRRRLFLIDGSSQMYRAYHAFRGRGLSGPDGHTTHAVYVFVTMLRKLIADHQPAYLAASFDVAGPTFRSQLATTYKANRAAMPPDLAEQIPWVHEACEALGVPILTVEGFEADDVIGSLAVRAAGEGFEVAVVTGDKDFFQLVHDGIKVYNPRDDGTWYDADGVVQKFGVRPDQVVDVLALMGDTIDNVKGVPGIGEKGARELITSHGTLDALLDAAGTLPQKKYREALLAHRADALQSRELVRIRTDVPVSVDFETLRYRGASRGRCYDLFTRLGFRSLTQEYAPTADTVEKDYGVIRDLDELDAAIEELREAGEFALRILPDAPAAMRAGIVGLAFSTADRRARYLPLGHEGLDSGGQIPRAEALARLKPLLEDAGVRKLGHDIKFEVIVLARHGITLRGLAFDSMLASYLLDATRSGHPLEDASLEHLGYKALTGEEICGRGVKALTLPRLPVDAILTYAGERADLARQLAHRLGPLLVTERLDALYREIEMPLIPVLADIERAGVRIDVAGLHVQSQRLERELADRSAQIFAMAGQEFNVNSPRQLSEILFDKLELPSLKRTGKTRTASTAAEVLEELALAHDLPRQIV